jgi:hypothetical protein
VHGFVSQGFLKTTDNNYLGHSKRGSFEFAEVGINFTKTLNDNLRAGVQLFARDLGRLGNLSPTFDWFYLDYHIADWLGIRLGRTKLPFGLYNEVNDIDSARVPILLPQSVYPVQNRDFLLAQTGGEVYGFKRLGDLGSIEYRGYGGTLFFDTSNSNTAAGTITDFSVPYLVGGRLMWSTPLRGLRVGGSLQALRLDLDFQPSATTLAPLQMAGLVPSNFNGVVKARVPALLWVASAEYSYHDFLLASEFSRWRVKTESSLPAVVPVSHVVSDRFYVMASYRLNAWLTPGAYYSVFFPKSGVWDTRSDYQHDVAATLRFDVDQNFLVKAEGHFMHGTASLDATENDNTPPNLLTRDWGLLLLKATAYF